MNTRWLSTFTLCFAVGSPLLAAEPPMMALKLVPAAEPVPSLKYRLLPELRDQTPGNAIMGYYRAFSPDWQSYRRKQRTWEPITQQGLGYAAYGTP